MKDITEHDFEHYISDYIDTLNKKVISPSYRVKVLEMEDKLVLMLYVVDYQTCTLHMVKPLFSCPFKIDSPYANFYVKLTQFYLEDGLFDYIHNKLIYYS